DKQGITGMKTEFQSIPYKSISRFSVETAGRFDLDSELNIWISGAELPDVSKQFKIDDSIYYILTALASVCM
ncbi:PH domain-containing protein, partial [Bacillus spizizenii]|uniref:PH domain-containing protein n=1 Tax=Bacillus spizizenii TaxID=96241 RepID=UPI001F61615B